MTTDEHIEWLSNQLAMATESLKIQMAVKEMAFKEIDRLKELLKKKELPDCPCNLMRYVPSMGELKDGHHPNCPGNWHKASG